MKKGGSTPHRPGQNQDIVKEAQAYPSLYALIFKPIFMKKVRYLKRLKIKYRFQNLGFLYLFEFGSIWFME